MDLKTKRCSRCGKVKPVSEFSECKKNKDKLHSQCKECKNKYQREYYKNNPEKKKEENRKYRENNPEKVKESNRKNRENNPEKVKESNRKRRQKNIEKHTEEYYQNLSGTKRCCKCKKEKDINEFSKSRTQKDGLHHSCKECCREYYKNNPEYSKNYHQKNKKYINKYNKKWRENNPEYQKKYRKNNPEKIKKINKRANKKFYSIPKNRLSNRISILMWYSLKGNKKGNHWEDLVGYTLQDLITHLESLFKPGISWENMEKWHIDHIRPISSFNFNSYNDPEFKECWRLKNLQPLWKFENLSKGAKISKNLRFDIKKTFTIGV